MEVFSRYVLPEGEKESDPELVQGSLTLSGQGATQNPQEKLDDMARENMIYFVVLSQRQVDFSQIIEDAYHSKALLVPVTFD